MLCMHINLVGVTMYACLHKYIYLCDIKIFFFNKYLSEKYAYHFLAHPSIEIKTCMLFRLLFTYMFMLAETHIYILKHIYTLRKTRRFIKTIRYFLLLL